MKKVIIASLSLFCVGVFFYLNAEPCFSEPKIPKTDIPADISDGLRQAIESLYSPAEDTKVEALRQLAEMKSGAVPAVHFVLGMMDDSSWKVRMGIAKALGEINSPEAVGPLISALKDENENVAYSAAIALGKIRDAKAAEPLAEALLSSSKYVRQYSAEALGEIGDEKTAKYLINLLKDTESDVRASTAKALGKIGNKGALKYIVPLLDDNKSSVQNEACGALVTLLGISGPLSDAARNLYSADKLERVSALDKLLGMDVSDEKLTVFLCGLLRERGMTGKKAGEALAKIGEPAIESINDKLKSDDSTARGNAILALGNIGGVKAIRLIIAAMDDNDKDVRSQAAKALVAIGQPAAADLANALSDSSANIRAYAARALGDIKDLNSVDALITALGGDSDSEVRAEAASALGKIGDTKALVPLTDALRDRSWEVRASAAESLGILADIRSAESLIAAMNDIKTEVKIKVIDAIGELKYDMTIEYMVGALNDPNRDVQMHTADALSRITGESFGRSIEKWKKWREKFLLSKLLDYKAPIKTKVMALELLQETRNPDYIETLFLVLKRDRSKPEVMENAAEALRKITGEDFGRDADAWEKWWRQDLIAGLDDSDRSKRVRTAKRLGELHSIVAIEPLVKKLNDTFADMREAAAGALKEITGEDFGTDAAAWQYWWEESKLSFQRSF